MHYRLSVLGDEFSIDVLSLSPPAPSRKRVHSECNSHAERKMQRNKEEEENNVDLLRHPRTIQKIWARLNAFVFPKTYGMAVQWVFLPG